MHSVSIGSQNVLRWWGRAMAMVNDGGALIDINAAVNDGAVAYLSSLTYIRRCPLAELFNKRSVLFEPPPSVMISIAGATTFSCTDSAPWGWCVHARYWRVWARGCVALADE